MIDGKNFFDQPINNDKITYENIRKIATSQEDDYTNDCLLTYPYFKDNYKKIAIDLSKQQALNSDLKAIQQITLTANLDCAGETRNFFYFSRSKINYFGFFTGNCKSIVNVL